MMCGSRYQEVPKWLLPIRTSVDFLEMDAGMVESKPFNTSDPAIIGFTIEEARETIRLSMIMAENPVGMNGTETILRDMRSRSPSSSKAQPTC
jgi:putative DNA primase/helicase